MWGFQFEKIENNLFNLSFTSTQAAWCEISPQHFESSDTPQEEPLTEEMKPESTVEAKAGAHGEWCLSTVSGVFLRSTRTSGKFRALNFFL